MEEWALFHAPVVYLLYLDTIICDKGGKLFSLTVATKEYMVLVALQGSMFNVINRAAHIIFCKTFWLYISALVNANENLPVVLPTIYVVT